MKSKIALACIFTFIILGINIFVFSPAFLGLSCNTAFKTAVGTGLISTSVIALIVGNIKILKNKKYITSQSSNSRLLEVNTLDDCIIAIEAIIKDTAWLETFTEHLEAMQKQINRLKKRESAITTLLLQKFSEGEMTYQLFAGSIAELKRVFEANIRSVLNRLAAFDDEEYREMLEAIRVSKPGHFGGMTREAMNQNLTSISGETGRARLQIYDGYITFVNQAIAVNEQIILKLDVFLAEVSTLKSLTVEEVKNMQIMREITELTQNIKLYKEGY